MEKKIVLTDDLANLFLTLSLKEGYCEAEMCDPYLNIRVSFTQNFLTTESCLYYDQFSMLSHLLLLYDKIELLTYNNDYSLHKNIKSIAEIKRDMPRDMYHSHLMTYESVFLPNELAVHLKPHIIHACMKFPTPKEFPDFNKYAIESAGSVEEYYSYMYDRIYNEPHLKINPRIESNLLPSNSSLDFSKPEEALAFIVHKRIEYCFKQFLLLQKLAFEGPRDFYSPFFTNFHSAINTNDAYCILKTQISMIMDEQPAFESLTDILRFRERKHSDIKLLRDEVLTLESLLIQGEREEAIQKAIKDVRSANQSLIKNTAAKKTARIATYLSVPVSLLELFTSGTSFSILIGVVGTTAQWIADKNDSKNNWLFVAR